jgi:hypothetical protein
MLWLNQQVLHGGDHHLLADRRYPKQGRHHLPKHQHLVQSLATHAHERQQEERRDPS